MLKPTETRDDEDTASPTDAAQRAFLTLLFNKYRGALLRHVGRFTSSREDAADLVHDTYLRVMDRINVSRFDAAAKAYLFQTATNLARDHHRRQRFRDHARLEDAPEERLVATAASPEQAMAADQVTATIRETLLAMPEATRAVFLLARTHDMSYDAIAAYLGIGRRTVERRMAEALAFLAHRIGGSR